MSRSVLKFYVLPGQQQMVTRVNHLLRVMKKQGSECVRIISLLKKIFGKIFKVFHKFADAANEFMKLFSL